MLKNVTTLKFRKIQEVNFKTWLITYAIMTYEIFASRKIVSLSEILSEIRDGKNN